jgi:hypothetical protein
MTRSVIFILLTLTFSCKTKPKKQEVKAEVFKNYNYRISINIWNGFYGFNNQYLLDNLNNDIEYSSKSMTLQCISYRQQQDKNNKNIKEFVPADTTKVEISKQSCDTLFELSKRFFRTFEFNNYDTVGQSKPIITDDSHSTIELSYGGRTLLARISSISNPTIATPEFDSLLNFIEKYKPTKKK